MLIDYIPVWALLFVTSATVLFAVEMGYRAGKTVTRNTDGERESPVSAIAAAILGLQAFMLAFTFSIVSDRYDMKKSLVREEANAIRTAWNRSDFLSESDRVRTKLLLKGYVDERVRIASLHDPELATVSLGNAVLSHHEMWAIAVANGRLDMNSDIGALYVESLNQIFELHALRVNIGLQSRIPSAIWFVLLGLLVFGMAGIGYQAAVADSQRPRASFILAFAFSLVVTLIAALDHPGNTLVKVSQQPMINLQMEMGDTPASSTEP